MGAIFASSNEHPRALDVILIIALGAGVAGLGGLICGGWLLVRETRFALKTIRQEMNFYRSRYTPQRPETKASIAR